MSTLLIKGTAWARTFLASEPDYGEFDWLDANAMMLSLCKRGLTPQQVAQAARDAYMPESWANLKIAAGLDALLGPMPPP